MPFRGAVWGVVTNDSFPKEPFQQVDVIKWALHLLVL